MLISGCINVIKTLIKHTFGNSIMKYHQRQPRKVKTGCIFLFYTTFSWQKMNMQTKIYFPVVNLLPFPVPVVNPAISSGYYLCSATICLEYCISYFKSKIIDYSHLHTNNYILDNNHYYNQWCNG